MTVHWKAKRAGCWGEQEPLQCCIRDLEDARWAVGQQAARDLIEQGEPFWLGFVPRTYAVWAAERAGKWPLAAVAPSGFNAIMVSYALYLPVQVRLDNGRWSRWPGLFGDARTKKLASALQKAGLEEAYRITHIESLRPTFNQRSAGAWLWEAQDPRGWTICGSLYLQREIFRAGDQLDILATRHGDFEIFPKTFAF